MGGQLALFAATIAPNDVSAAVDFYGIHPDVKPDFSKLSCPVLGLFGDKDAGVNPEVVRQLVADIEAAGGQIDHTIYPGADHAFFNDARPEVYHPEAAKSAWEKTLAFLDRHLV
jgi:carboxymethylenebutenolidase